MLSSFKKKFCSYKIVFIPYEVNIGSSENKNFEERIQKPLYFFSKQSLEKKIEELHKDVSTITYNKDAQRTIESEPKFIQGNYDGSTKTQYALFNDFGFRSEIRLNTDYRKHFEPEMLEKILETNKN